MGTEACQWIEELEADGHALSYVCTYRVDFSCLRCHLQTSYWINGQGQGVFEVGHPCSAYQERVAPKISLDSQR